MGPPPVVCWTSSKILNTPVMIRIATVEMLDFIIGMMMYHTFCLSEAPSMSAASKMSSGIILSPAMKIVVR